MKKYIFAPDETVMAAQNPKKTQSDLDNIINATLPRYGKVEEYIDISYSTQAFAENPSHEGTEQGQALQNKLDEVTAALAAANAELTEYAPIISFIKNMKAESLNRIEELTKRTEAAEGIAAELSEFAELIEAAKKLKG